MSVILKSPYEMSQEIAKKVKQRRLSLNLSQKTLSEKSGVSYGTLKKFENTGKISLGSLLQLALILGELDSFDQVFTKNTNKLPKSLDDLLKEEKVRKRGRK